MKRMILLGLLLVSLSACGQAVHRSAGEGACPVRERPVSSGRPAARIPVLLYHHLAPEATGLHLQHEMVIPAELFAAQVAWLTQEGYYTPTLGELHAFLAGEIDLPERSVVITFDDGYESAYQFAQPVLCASGLRAVLFKIGGRAPNEGAFDPNRLTHLRWEQLDEMVRSGIWAVESHTFYGHDLVDGRPPLLAWSDEQIEADLQRVQDVWRRNGLPPPAAVAYPSGAYDERALAAAQRTGLQLGFTTESGFVAPGADPLRLPRIAIFPADTLAGFQARLTGGDGPIPCTEGMRNCMIQVSN